MKHGACAPRGLPTRVLIATSGLNDGDGRTLDVSHILAGRTAIDRRDVRNVTHVSGMDPVETGAGGRTRTDDLLITNQLLYQLSYAGKARWANARF